MQDGEIYEASNRSNGTRHLHLLNVTKEFDENNKPPFDNVSRDIR